MKGLIAGLAVGELMYFGISQHFNLLSVVIAGAILLIAILVFWTGAIEIRRIDKDEPIE
jgi:hypothetical protein